MNFKTTYEFILLSFSIGELDQNMFSLRFQNTARDPIYGYQRQGMYLGSAGPIYVLDLFIDLVGIID